MWVGLTKGSLSLFFPPVSVEVCPPCFLVSLASLSWLIKDGAVIKTLLPNVDHYNIVSSITFLDNATRRKSTPKIKKRWNGFRESIALTRNNIR